MDYHYGVPVTNKFVIIGDDDEDPLELLRQHEEAQIEKQKALSKISKETVKTDTKGKGASKIEKNKQNNKKVLTPVQDPKNKQNENNITKKEEKNTKKVRPQGESYQSQDSDKSSKPIRENRDRDIPPRRAAPRDGEKSNRQQPFYNSNERDRDQRGGDRVDRNERRERPERPERWDSRDQNERGENTRGRGGTRGMRGRGRGRGGFGTAAAPVSSGGFGKREYERRSGSDKTSGVKATEKREGAGAHNWGTVQDDIAGDTMNDSNVSEEGPAEWTAQSKEEVENQDPNQSKPEGDEEEKVEDGEPAEPEAEEMTLEEYRESLKEAKMPAKSFNIRKAGEGVDNTQWKKMYVLKKKEEPEEEDDEDEEEEEEEEDRPKKKNFVPIEITFADNPRRGGGRGSRRPRGGRGANMGDRGRGGMGERGRGGGSFGGRGEMGDRSPGRGSRGGGRFARPDRGNGRGKREQAPDVLSEQEFPAIGKAMGS